jgi:cysteine-rich repeat protein
MSGHPAGAEGGAIGGNPAGSEGGAMGGNQMIAVCGNGRLEGTEACDDGNNLNNDGCSSACVVEMMLPRCGNAVLEGAEACDDGNLFNGDGCSAQCTVEIQMPRCGNGVLEGTEECDDGNLFNNDGCSSQCIREIAMPRCGNGIREGAEACDDGNLNNGDGCSAQCTVEAPQARCGNSILEGAEACDDGNLNNGDGCSAQCTVEAPTCVPTDAEIEENSSLALATAFTGAMNGQICTGDQDWFIIPSCGNGGQLTINVNFTHANGDIDVELLDANQQILTSSRGASDQETIVYQNMGVTSDLYLRVFGFMPTVVNAYSFTATYNCSFPSDSGDVIFPNNSSDQASRITRGQDSPLTITPNDVDYFKTNVCKSGTLIISTTFRDIFGDLDITLFDENNVFLANAISTEDNETLFYDNRSGNFQNVFIKIYGVGADSNEYILNVDQIGCEDDLYENNGNSNLATQISTNTYPNLVLLPEDEDWYRISLQIPQHTYQFEINYLYSPFGDLDMELFDQNLNSLCTARSSSNIDTCLHDHYYTFNTLYLKVYGFSGSQNQYTLTVSANPF